jgi:hypothetical protein
MILVIYRGASCKTLLCGVGCFRFKIDINSILVCNIMQGTVKEET